MTQSIIAPSPRVRTIKLIQHPAFRGAPVHTERRHHAGAQPVRVGSVEAPSVAGRPVAIPVRPPVAARPAFDGICLAA